MLTEFRLGLLRLIKSQTEYTSRSIDLCRNNSNINTPLIPLPLDTSTLSPTPPTCQNQQTAACVSASSSISSLSWHPSIKRTAPFRSHQNKGAFRKTAPFASHAERRTRAIPPPFWRGILFILWDRTKNWIILP